MSQVNNFAMSRLSNAFHASFHHAIATQLNEVGESSLGLSTGFITQYKLAIEQEQDIVNRTMGSAKTERLRAQDVLRDNYFTAVRNVLKNAKYSSNTEIYGLYEVIYKKLIKPYPGSIRYESDHTESSHIRGFIIDVKQYLTESQITALGIKSDLDALASANEAFESIYLERVDEQVQNPAGYATVCREKVDSYWATLVRTIDYYANETANPDDSIKSIASVANGYIERLNKHISTFWHSVNASGANGTQENGNANGNSNGNSGSQESGNSGTSGTSGTSGSGDSGNGGNTGGSGTNTGIDKPIEKDDKLTPGDNSDSGYKGDM